MAKFKGLAKGIDMGYNKWKTHVLMVGDAKWYSHCGKVWQFLIKLSV